jgi:hypothetical protein
MIVATELIICAHIVRQRRSMDEYVDFKTKQSNIYKNMMKASVIIKTNETE